MRRRAPWTAVNQGRPSPFHTAAVSLLDTEKIGVGHAATPNVRGYGIAAGGLLCSRLARLTARSNAAERLSQRGRDIRALSSAGPRRGKGLPHRVPLRGNHLLTTR